jgi:hypothetical protein
MMCRESILLLLLQLTSHRATNPSLFPIRMFLA